MDTYDYIEMPNLPDNPVKLVVLDGRATKVGQALENMGIEVVYTEKIDELNDNESYHPDMMMHHLGGRDIVVAPNASENFCDQLKKFGFNIIKGGTILNRNYPYNIAYNVARIGKYAFHILNYTDEVLRNELIKRGIKLIDVKQGYTKCSICVLDKDTIITSDKGIEKIAKKIDVNVFGIDAGGIRLYNYDYGFIGGSTGLLDRNVLGLTGNINKYLFKDKLKKILNMKKIWVKSLTQDEIIDTGSIIPLLEVKS